MFVVREFVRECRVRPFEELVSETPFGSRTEAERFLKDHYDILVAQEELWSGVWARSLNGDRYTLDNIDGDFFEGCIAMGGTAK